MLRKALFPIIAPVFLALLFAGCGSESDLPTVPEEGYGQGTLYPQSDGFMATIGDDSSDKYYVYTPEGYSNSSSMPVLYLLNGFGRDENYFVGIFDARDALDQLVAEGEIEPMVIVMPSGHNKLGGSFYTDSPHPAVGGSEQHILDVIAEVEADYSGIDNTRRAIGGHSMGGYGALSIAMNNPGMFSAVAVLSGPISFWGELTPGMPPPGDPSTAYAGLRTLLPVVLKETGYDTVLTATGGAGDPSAWRNMMYPGEERPVTSMMFALSAAFSPFNPADPYLPTLLDSMVAGVDEAGNIVRRQPIGINLPVGHDGDVDSTTWTRWMNYDPVTRLLSGAAASLAGVKMYFDVGEDEANPDYGLGLNGAHLVFGGALQAAGFTPFDPGAGNSDTADFWMVSYDGFNDLFGYYPAGHTEQVYERLKETFRWLGDQL